MFIRFVTTGGTIDKVYFDALSRFEVGDSPIRHILTEGLVDFDYDVVSLFQKDSLEMSDEDRQALKEFVKSDKAERFIVSHGTDTMVETAKTLTGVCGKIIVLTGALSPARFKSSDAVFNVGMAVAAVQTLGPGVYLAMNGQVFEAGNVRKNSDKNCFETIRN